MCFKVFQLGASVLRDVLSLGITHALGCEAILCCALKCVFPWAQILNSFLCDLGFSFLHPATANYLRLKFPHHFWELDICLSYFREWLYIFVTFPPALIAFFFYHIDQSLSIGLFSQLA